MVVFRLNIRCREGPIRFDEVAPTRLQGDAALVHPAGSLEYLDLVACDYGRFRFDTIWPISADRNSSSPRRKNARISRQRASGRINATLRQFYFHLHSNE